MGYVPVRVVGLCGWYAEQRWWSSDGVRGRIMTKRGLAIVPPNPQVSICPRHLCTLTLGGSKKLVSERHQACFSDEGDLKIASLELQ